MKIYIHIWHDGKTGEDFMHEQTFTTSIDEAIKQYDQENFGDFVYRRTLELETDTKDFKSINIEEIIEERKELPFQYERLTGHEMGVCPGRV